MKRIAAILAILAASPIACCITERHPCPTADDGDAFECFVGHVSEDDGAVCLFQPIPNGHPCRGGIGTCKDGECKSPHPPGQGICHTPPGLVDGDWNPCASAQDPCPDNIDHGCVFVPKTDGTSCGDGLACFAGLCCMKTNVFECKSDSDCATLNTCETGSCTNGTCAFAFANPGTSCKPETGLAGKCEIPAGGFAPVCVPMSPGS